MWQSLVTIGQATLEIRRRENEKDLNYSGKTEWPAQSVNLRATIKTLHTCVCVCVVVVVVVVVLVIVVVIVVVAL